MIISSRRCRVRILSSYRTLVCISKVCREASICVPRPFHPRQGHNAGSTTPHHTPATDEVEALIAFPQHPIRRKDDKGKIMKSNTKPERERERCCGGTPARQADLQLKFIQEFIDSLNDGSGIVSVKEFHVPNVLGGVAQEPIQVPQGNLDRTLLEKVVGLESLDGLFTLQGPD